VQPLVAVLTNVGLDHTEILGDTVEEIARDKVAIIKPGCIAITGVTQPNVREIVAERAATVGIPLWRLGDEIRLNVLYTHQNNSGGRGVTFHLHVNEREREHLHLNLIGLHQAKNAALAIAATDALSSHGLTVSDDVIQYVLETVSIPGRLEIVSQKPTIILDGAHNPDKIDALLAALRHFSVHRRLVVVAAFTRRLAPVVDHLVLTSFAMYSDFGPGQAIAPDELAALFAMFQPRGTFEVVPNPIAAVAAAREWANSDDCVCVTGSLYLVGAVRDTLLNLG